VEGGRRRAVPVCDVHRRLVLPESPAQSAASAGRAAMLAPMNNPNRRKASACSS
jgi:hypothetical protein